jgi:hypothetical protein
VFIDGQTDFYGEDLTREYGQIVALHGWRQKLIDRGIEIVLIDRRSALAAELSTAAGWSLMHEDSTAVLYLRNTIQTPD